MSEYTYRARIGADDLQLMALLYASGLLDARQSADFEKLLGEDQKTREALAKATRQLLKAGNKQPVKPSPEYRRKVKERLRPKPQRQIVGVAAKKRRKRGDPVMWVIVGAVVAILLVVGVTWFVTPGSGPTSPLQKTPFRAPTRLNSADVEAPFEVESAGSGADKKNKQSETPTHGGT